MQKFLFLCCVASLYCLYSCTPGYSNQNVVSLASSVKVGTENTIDYNTFSLLTQEMAPYRNERLIDIESFAAMLEEENVLLLDTRSKAAYDDIHIKGAVHFNFSDFTAPKLAAVIPSQKTRILIYCNNNFVDGGASLYSKSPALALNIPTFINLVGYGYEDVYELSSLLTLQQAEKFLDFEGTSSLIGAMNIIND